MDRCMVYTRVRLFLHIRPFIPSFLFLSNFHTLKFFFTLFSGTVRLRRLKHGTHMDNGQMYLVYQNQAAPTYLSLYSFIFLSFHFSNKKIFRHTFLWNCEAWKVETCYTHGKWVDVSCVLESCCCSYLSLYFFIFLSLQFSDIKNFRHTFLRNYEA